MKSSRKKSDQILGVISKKRAEQLLIELANAQLPWYAFENKDRAPSTRILKYWDVLSPEKLKAQPTSATSYDFVEAGPSWKRIY